VRAADVASALSPDLGEKMDADDIRPGVLEPMSANDASQPGVYVQILDVTGHIFAASGTKLPVDRAQVRRVLTGVQDVGWLGSDERPRVLSRPVVARSGSLVGVVQGAQSARFLDSALSQVRTLMAVGTALTLLGAGAIGWLLAGRALWPITELTAAADHIVATGRLDARIAEARPADPASRDEVGTLVRSFNSMVERLEGAFEQQRRLLADTSHELRNSLAAIRAYLEIIEGSDAPDALSEAAAETKDEVLRVSRLVGDLLLLGQTDAAARARAYPGRHPLSSLAGSLGCSAGARPGGEAQVRFRLGSGQFHGRLDRAGYGLIGPLEAACSRPGSRRRGWQHGWRVAHARRSACRRSASAVASRTANGRSTGSGTHCHDARRRGRRPAPVSVGGSALHG
jgi:HAMP domain-containing protein